MGFGDLLGPGLDGYLISDSLARMNDFPSLSAMGAAYLHGSFIGGFVSYLYTPESLACFTIISSSC